MALDTSWLELDHERKNTTERGGGITLPPGHAPFSQAESI